MTIREHSIYAVRQMAQAEREELGFLVLVMRHWARGVPATLVDARIPDAAPSQSLLNQASIKKNKETPENILPWSVFQDRYLAEQQALNTCRVIFYDKEGLPHAERWDCSPTKAIIKLEVEHSNVTLLCWEAVGCNCHRIPLLAAIQQYKEHCKRNCIEAISTALTQSPTVKVRICTHPRWETAAWNDPTQRLLSEAEFSIRPYIRLGNELLYSASLRSEEQTRQLLALPYIYSIEVMPTYSPAATAQKG